mgnify:CR=1 FL=1
MTYDSKDTSIIRDDTNDLGGRETDNAMTKQGGQQQLLKNNIPSFDLR